MKNIIVFLLVFILLVGGLYYAADYVIVKKVEEANNLFMEDLKRDMENSDFSLEYDKFKCSLNLLKIKCTSNKIKLEDIESTNNVITYDGIFKTSESVYTSKVNILNGYNSLFSSSKSPLDLRVIMFSKLIPDEKKMESKINLSINNQDLSFVSDFDVQEEDDIFSKGSFYSMLLSKEFKNYMTSNKILDIKDLLKKSTGRLYLKNLANNMHLDYLNVEYEISDDKLNLITDFSLGNEKDEFYIKDLKCTYNSGMKNGIYSIKNDCKSKTNIIDIYLNYDILLKDIKARNGKEINSVYEIFENIDELTSVDYFAFNNLNISFFSDNLVKTTADIINTFNEQKVVTSQEILDNVKKAALSLDDLLLIKDLSKEEREFAKDIQRFLLDINAYSKGIEILINNKSKDKFYNVDKFDIEELSYDLNYNIEVK